MFKAQRLERYGIRQHQYRGWGGGGNEIERRAASFYTPGSSSGSGINFRLAEEFRRRGMSS
jgi:hypothetical protein